MKSGAWYPCGGLLPPGTNAKAMDKALGGEEAGEEETEETEGADEQGEG